MQKVCWVSVDPRNRKIDFYPRAIAERIEYSYKNRDQYIQDECVLGSSFFNATVHFHPIGSCYQTTPGMSMGRAGFKQPGYRSVKRCIKDPESDTITIYLKQVHSEWRIVMSYIDSTIILKENILPECLIDGDVENVTENIRAWTGEDLSSGAWDANVFVWQWCRGVPERQGDLMLLSDEWWCPYLANENNAIETAFMTNELNVDIDLPICGTRTFKFTPGNVFATQNDVINHKTRLVRRVTKTIQDLKVMLDRMSTSPVDIAELLSSLPDGTIPHHFFCCISQAIMSDPVKTIDGHIYDRPSIEHWFQINDTSPLTGLHLASTALEPHTELRQQIERFVKSKV